MPASADRRAELIAAALAGELSPDERAELDALRAADPGVDDELAALGAVTAALPAIWTDLTPSADLRDRIAAVDASGSPSPRDAAPSVARAPAPRALRRLPLVLAGAACLALGAGLALGAQSLATAPPTGAPGTLGALESIEFDTAGVAVDGALVAHTWGTETVLEIDGAEIGERYSVVVVDESGEAESSGTFLGSEVTVTCRMNAAVLREDVTAIEIRDASGTAVATATVPSVDS